MKDKYFEALCVLGEVLIDTKNEIYWKDMQLDMKDKEIASLKAKLEEIERYMEEIKGK